MTSNRTILITGVTGKQGGALAQALQGAGFNLRDLTRKPIDLPWIPGHEFSGGIKQIGSDVAAWAAGDAVFGTTSGMDA